MNITFKHHRQGQLSSSRVLQMLFNNSKKGGNN